MRTFKTVLKKTFYRVIEDYEVFYIQKITYGFINLDGDENESDRTSVDMKFTTFNNFDFHKREKKHYYEVEIVTLDEEYKDNRAIVEFMGRYRRNGRLKKYAYAV